uniref:Uncharacterized protein n=1 Tax=Oryza barthii TaxID=65489 RepID=A0A0D3G2T2_9ORYZ
MSTTGMLMLATAFASDDDDGRSVSGLTYRSGIVAAPLSDSACTLTTGSGQPPSPAASAMIDRSLS